ncbi:hypothetical protein C366_00074 [Cryptococcus neoformans Tu401-1]|nr:hypothetical protein C365_00076 [Cryptococcus neoformans var. grubii Bt85]OXC66053.1 hypothetical protein AYX13_05099 [Cryptococcus neoformans var. grubii]OXG24545.1 hypothetical protein C366_00074 [Cryptococcus neoformans var. grubii Tu401-1]OXG36555.1 hypothetical protein C367_00082 [Cryptococcus neoformans var. grubii Ze90-1]
MATVTATMDDLIASLSGNMHVSQEGYDLKALHEFLAQNLPLPFPSPTAYAYPVVPRPPPLSRKPSSLPSYTHPSPTPTSLPLPYNQTPHPPVSYERPQSSQTPAQRPAPLRRASSFGTVPHSYAPAANSHQAPEPSYAAFESDAFAPFWQGAVEETEREDPWARIRNAPTGDFGFAAAQEQPQITDGTGTHQYQWGLQLGGCGQSQQTVMAAQSNGDVGMDMDEDEDMEDNELVESLVEYGDENDTWRRGKW